MATKLARQMALKKKLEEEYREANERLNESMKLSRAKKYVAMSFDLEYLPKHPVIELRERNIVSYNCTEENSQNQEISKSEVTTAKELSKVSLETEIVDREKEERERQERLAEEEETKRLEEEAERKKKEEDDRRRREETRRSQEEERRRKMREKLKRAEARRRKEEAEKKEFEELRSFVCDTNEEDVEKQEALKQEQLKEVARTEEQIRKLEMNIASLDMELERFDLEEMRNKTRKVVKRMSLVMKDSEEDKEVDNEMEMILQSSTVKGFMQDKILWGKYVSRGSAAN